jgi:hypothetical protein
MTDQTKWGIDEVVSQNRAKKYENETKKKFEKWLEQSPVEYQVQLHQDEDVLVTFKIKQRRKDVPNNK